VADARRLPGGDVLSAAVDDVVEHIDGLAERAASDTRAIVTRAVPPDLVDVVTARIVDRLDLVPWVPLTAEGYFRSFGVKELAFDDEGCALPMSDSDDANRIHGARALWVLFGATTQNSLFDLDDRQAEARASGFGRYIPEAASPSFWADVYPRLNLVQARDAFWELQALTMKHSDRVEGLIPPRDMDAVADIVTRLDAHGPRWLSGSARRLFNAHGESAPLVRLVAWFLVEAMRPASLASLAATILLDAAKVSGDAVALDDTALVKLTAEVERALGYVPTTSAPPVVDGLHPHDEALAKQLESIGAEGRAGAAKLRKAPDKSAARWAPYVHAAMVTVDVSGEKPEARFPRAYPPSKPLHAAKYLAQALWLDVVRPKLDRLSSSHAALARVVHVDVIGLLRPGLSVRDNHIVDTDGRQRMLWTQSQALDVPTVEMGALPKLLKRGIEKLGSIQAHRIVRHVVVEGHRRVITGEADPRVLRYQGGWSGFAQQANVTEPEDAREIVFALAHAVHELPDGAHGNLLLYTVRRGTKGNPGSITITLGDMLLPHFVHSIDQSKGRAATEHRQLVPIVDFAGFVGRNNGHAAQATLQMMLVARLRTAAAELAETGAVTIRDSELLDLAAEAGLSRDLLPKVIDRWTCDGDDAPAFLVKQGDRYTLAEHFRPALDFLVDAGQQSIARSKAGKASVARRGKATRKAKD
jgi:hypothetical protein